MPEKVNVWRFSENLRREFGLVAGITPQLDETIAPVVIVSDLSQFEAKAAGFGDSMAAGGAGVFNSFGLWNELDTGKLVRVEGAYITSGTAQEMRIGIIQASVGALVTANWRDWREEGFPSAQFWTDAGVVVAPVRRIAHLRIGTTLPAWYPLGCVLPPGTGIEINAVTANLGIQGSLFWTEEVLLPAG